MAGTPFYHDHGFPVVVVADDGVEDAAAAVAAAGGRLVDTIGWADAPAKLGAHAVTATFLVEAAGASPAALDALLPRLGDLLHATDQRAVICFTSNQIDAVAAALLGARAQLLCDPSPAERVAALALYGELTTQSPIVSDATRDSEAARLQRLNDEVARIASVLARLSAGTTRHDERDASVADRRQRFEVAPPADVTVAPGEVRAAIRARRLRDKFLPGGLFEDPAWDMLLDLFAAELERAQVSVSSLCIAAAVPPTTALRWIGKLTDAGLLERRPDPFDKRRAFMALSTAAREGMRRYYAALQAAGMPIA